MARHKLYTRGLLIAGLLATSTTVLMGCGKDNDQSDSIDVSQENTEVSDGKILEGITIEDVAVGGMTTAEAVTALKASKDSVLQTMTITLQNGTQSWVLSSQDLGIEYDYDASVDEALRYSESASKDEKKQIKESGKALPLQVKVASANAEAKLVTISNEVKKEAVDPKAEFTPEQSNRFTYTDGIAGEALNIDATMQQVQAAIDAKNFPATIPLVMEVVQPEKTVDDLKQNTQRITTASTSYQTKGKENRAFNIKKGTEILHGVVVQPGDSFSFNETTGNRNEKNGWKAAPTIVDGTMFEDDFGGGICQVSTTLYNAVAKAGLKVTERNKHSIPSTYVPLGLDAMVSYGSSDFRFVNNTDYPVYITGTADGSTLTFAIWGRPLPNGESIKLRSETLEEVQPPDPEIMEADSLAAGQRETVRSSKKGYNIQVYKERYDANGKLIDSEKAYKVSYSPIRAVVRVGAGSSTSTSDSSTSATADTGSSNTDSGSSDSGSDSSDNTTSHDGFDIPIEED